MRGLLERISSEGNNIRGDQSASLHPLRRIVRINFKEIDTKKMQGLYEKGLLNQENLHLFNEEGQNAVMSKIQSGDIEAAIFLLYHGFNPSMRISSDSRDTTSDFIKEYRIMSRHIIYPGGGQNDDNLLPTLDFAERRSSAIYYINKGDAAGLKGVLESFINKQVKFKINAEEVTRNEIDLVQKDLLQEAIYKKPEMIIVLLQNGIGKDNKIKDSKGDDITILDFLIKKRRWFTDNKDVNKYEDVNKYIDSQKDNEVDSWKEKVSGGVASRCLSTA